MPIAALEQDPGRDDGEFILIALLVVLGVELIACWRPMIYGRPRTVVAPDLLLLDSKLSVPRPRPGFVSRAGLIEKAREGGCRVIGLTAPAGYGKSTLLVEWALAEDRPVVWVSFDRLGGDPARVASLPACAVGPARAACAR